METKSLDDLKANSKNPRRISEHDFNALKASLREFGDLSAVVFNVRSQQLVGGHQRTEAFKALPGQKQVVIERRLETPDKQGTVAEGYILHDDVKFPYREVDWDNDREVAANIAANRIQGEFDLDLLAEANAMLKAENPDLLARTGQTDTELKRLEKMAGIADEEEEQGQNDDGLRPFEVRMTEPQLSIVLEALSAMKRQRTLTMEQNPDLDGNALFYVCQEFLSSNTESQKAKTTTDAIPAPEPTA